MLMYSCAHMCMSSTNVHMYTVRVHVYIMLQKVYSYGHVYTCAVNWCYVLRACDSPLICCDSVWGLVPYTIYLLEDSLLLLGSL